MTVVAVVLVLSMIFWKKSNSALKNNSTEIPEPTKTNLANPASVNCTEKGGQIEPQTKPDGSQYALCFFDDNRACEEWAMYRGECPVGGRKTTGYDTEAQKFCAWSGGQTIAMENAICTFSNGSTCPDEAFYTGTCQK